MNNEQNTKQVDESQKRIDEVSQVARKIHVLVGESVNEIPILKGEDGVETAKHLKWYQTFIQEKIVPAVTIANLRTGDIEFLTSLILQPIDLVREGIQDILTDSVREVILEKLAREIITFMANNNSTLPIGDIPKDKHEAMKEFVKQQVQNQLASVVDKMIDIQAVMDIVAAPYKLVNQILSATRTMVEENAVASKFGLKNLSDLRFSHIIATQMENAEKKDVV